MKYFSVNKDYPKPMYYPDQERFSEVKLAIIDEVDHLKYTSHNYVIFMIDINLAWC
jgi:hypothetical protein